MMAWDFKPLGAATGGPPDQYAGPAENIRRHKVAPILALLGLVPVHTGQAIDVLDVSYARRPIPRTPTSSIAWLTPGPGHGPSKT
ncbi:hypothetical protein GCM10017711_00790 [Paeniglutamicibacter sulfureus]